MTSTIKEKIGLKIRELRILRRIKQCELADMLNMERSHLTRIENGKHRPSDENLEKIASVLKVRIKDLFDFDSVEDIEYIKSELNFMLENYPEDKLRTLYVVGKNL